MSFEAPAFGGGYNRQGQSPEPRVGWWGPLDGPLSAARDGADGSSSSQDAPGNIDSAAKTGSGLQTFNGLQTF